MKLFAIIERLQCELAIVQESADSCSSIVSDYEALLTNMHRLQGEIFALANSKDETIELDRKEINLLKRKAKMLHRKAIATGVLVPVAAAGAGVVITFLVLKFYR